MAAGAPPGTGTGIGPAQVTGVVLAGGRGTRMGGADKGLQLFDGAPLALHALRRLQKQVGCSMLNANRNLDGYSAFGVPVWPDEVAGYAGPLAGFITALRHCETPYLVTVPCDTPLFPTDLVARLAAAMQDTKSEITMAHTWEEQDSGQMAWRAQPMFCLLHKTLLPSLELFLAQGGRKAEAWTSTHRAAAVHFDQCATFSNANTLAELQALRLRERN